MILKELLNKLSYFDKDTQIVVSDGGKLFNEIESYRGNYSDIYIARNSNAKRIHNVGQLYDALDASLGKDIYGYKGGEYIVWDTAEVYYAEYGHTGLLVTDVIQKGKNVVLVVEEY